MLEDVTGEVAQFNVEEGYKCNAIFCVAHGKVD